MEQLSGHPSIRFEKFLFPVRQEYIRLQEIGSIRDSLKETQNSKDWVGLTAFKKLG